MTAAQIALAVTLPVVFLPLGLAKTAALPFMRQAAAHLGMSPDRYRVIGAREVAGVIGLLLGLVAGPLGVAAAIGLPLLMAAAAGARLRHGDPPMRALPAVVLAHTGICRGDGLRGLTSSEGSPMTRSRRAAYRRQCGRHGRRPHGPCCA
ncbi:DoxX family protein [Streptomyces arenae]|uniref:DoxX family protein n=1 Tax=Streptomyces arenae TaxID=29301 RepID=UPI00265B556C|nr:DoxX family protein [Streptomyces arenae]MCG7204739.1 DoxX family protein [Streptomyces arenae]